MTNEEYKTRVVEYLKGSPSQEVLAIIATIVDHVAEQDPDWLSEDDFETLHHQVFGAGWREEFGFEYWCNEWVAAMDFQEQAERLARESFDTYEIQPDGPLGDMAPPPY